MNANRILYRTRQFWQALGASLTSEDWDLVRALLTPDQLALFEGMQESEQAHALRVLHALLEQGEEHSDLFVAALLHDVGKSRFPLKLWERVLIVLGQAFFPNLAKRLASEPSDGLGLPTEAHSPAPERRSPSPLPSSRVTFSVAAPLLRPFIVAERHPNWGAEMAAEAGASWLVVALIRRHQDDLDGPRERGSALEQELLRKLHSVDDHS
jgi:hypothetical protein